MLKKTFLTKLLVKKAFNNHTRMTYGPGRRDRTWTWGICCSLRKMCSQGEVARCAMQEKELLISSHRFCIINLQFTESFQPFPPWPWRHTQTFSYRLPRPSHHVILTFFLIRKLKKPANWDHSHAMSWCDFVHKFPPSHQNVTLNGKITQINL